ncbi:MAG: alpha/beta hydrolase [Polyangiaceae bacterium]|nr:alpha/beta hydrolase [Polyangiaceae bacterium]
MRVRTSDGHELSVRIIGDGSLPVLFIHGWMVSGAVWSDLFEILHPRGQKLIVPDHRGSGDSDRPDNGYTIDRYVEDMIAVADAAGAKRFAVVGHSMGGQIAQVLAARHPERVIGAALLSPVPASGIPMPPEVVELFSTCAGNREKQTAILGAACKELSAATRDRILDDSVRTSEPCIRQAFEAFRTGGYEAELGDIRAPVLCVACDDPFFPIDFLQKAVVGQIARGSLVHLPGPGHYLANERPRETAAIVGAFLAGLPREADA